MKEFRKENFLEKIDNLEYVFELNNICKSIDNQEILKDINIKIKENSITGLVGQNGAGKTTLLRILTGVYDITSGELKTNVDLNEISIMLDRDFFIMRKTGYDNIKHFCDYFDVNFKEEKEYAELMAEKLGIKDVLEQKVITYSKGMLRKLSFLVTLLRKTKVIILDEPASGVDPVSRQDLRKILEFLQQEGRTIIITSHDLVEIHKTCNSTLMIHEGKFIKEYPQSIDIETFENEYVSIIKGEQYE